MQSPFGIGRPAISPLGESGRRLEEAIGAAVALVVPTSRSASGLAELGLTLGALGERGEAIATLRRAVQMKPGLAAAWRGLCQLLSDEGDGPESRKAQEVLARLAMEPSRPARSASAGKIAAAERSARELIGRGPPQAAGGALRAHLRQSPGDAAALRMLAEIGVRAGHLGAAEPLLARALDLAPDYIAARHAYASLLIMLGKPIQALGQIDRLAAEQPRQAQYRLMRAQTLAGLGQYDAAITAYEGLRRDFGVNDPPFWVGYGNALKYAGQREASVAAYRSAIALAPAMGAAYWGLANLKNETFSQADMNAMEAAVAAPGVAGDDRVHLHYALGSALEQRGAYGESFAHYVQGARLRRRENGYNAQAWRAEMQRSMRFFSAGYFAKQGKRGWGDGAPIFIIGLPRAGSTLIEQILASHSLVEGTQELPEIGNIVRMVGRSFNLGEGSVYPERLARMDAQEIGALGASYIANTRFYRKTPKPYYIDKMPGNWAYAGLIRTILPHAHIIDIRRAPMASCFAAFKQLFGAGADYSYDLADLGMYYHDYLDMMAHMDKVQPGRIHRVLYEDLVEDTEGEIRRLLAYCGLNFEPACLRFWESTRAVSTPSAEQVRQPIYREGLSHWRNYEPWLEPLALALDNKA